MYGNIRNIFEISNINSERIVCIELKNQSYGSLFIFEVYLPSDESIESYKHELNILDPLCTYYSNFGNVIIAGDLNASCQGQDHDRSNKYKSIELTKFINRQFLSYAGNQIQFKGPNYTYTTKETMLDYILFNEGVVRQIRSYEILSEGSISSTSDHLPNVVKIKLDYNPHRLSNSYMKSPAWQKLNDENLNNYQAFLNDPLDFLLERMNYANPSL